MKRASVLFSINGGDFGGTQKYLESVFTKSYQEEKHNLMVFLHGSLFSQILTE